MKCFRVFCLLGISLLVPMLAINTASAQAVVSGNYYEDKGSSSCSATNACAIVFSQTPRYVLFTDVSCHVFASAGSVYEIYFGVQDVASPPNLSPRRTEYFSAVNTATNDWVVRSKTNFLLGGGAWPVLIAWSTQSGSMGFSCKIVGTLNIP